MKRIKPVCDVDGCTKLSDTKGKCRPHYKSSLYYSNPEPIRKKNHARYWGNVQKSRDDGRDKRLGEGASKHFREQITLQLGACAICRTPTHIGQGGLGLDHNHTTGAWRGALCARCNSGIGDFMDNASLLFAAVEYLRKWEKVQ